MDHELLGVSEKIYEGEYEQSVECDIIVPDYMPDVLKILRVDATPRINSTLCQKDVITVEGAVELNILYIPEEGGSLRCLRHSCYFEHSFDVKGADDSTLALAQVANQFINCKLTNARKLGCRVGVLISLSAENQAEISCVRPDSEAEVEMLTTTRVLCSLVGSAVKDFRVEEELELPAGKSAAKNIIWCDAQVIPEEQKLIANKIIVKGTVHISMLYEAKDEVTDGGMDQAEYDLPFSQIVELDGVDDDCICHVSYGVMDREYQVLDDFDQQARTLSIGLDIRAQAFAYRNQESAFVSDAYSTQFECVLEHSQITLTRVCEPVQSQITVKDGVEAPNGVTSLLSSSACAFPPVIRWEGKRLFITSTADLFLLIRNGEGDIENLEKQLPIEFVVDMAEECIEPDVTCEVAVDSATCSMAGSDGLSLRLQMSTRAIVRSREKAEIISDISVDTERPLTVRRSSVVLYYPEQEESFWEIAKRYGASADQIKELNGVEGDTCGKGMLLIPRKK